MSLKEFEIVKKLGSGSFSEVFHVRRISDQTEYAMKKVKLQKLSKKEQENALNEMLKRQIGVAGKKRKLEDQ